MSKAQLEYHQATFDLLDQTQRVSNAAKATLDALEQAHSLSLPASVREWYSLEGAVEILSAHNNSDFFTPLEELAVEVFEVRGGPRTEGRLLPLMDENQGVCRWAVVVNGQDDPPVVVTLEPESIDSWERYVDRFSTFIWTQIWDWKQLLSGVHGCGLAAQDDSPLSSNDLDFLRLHFTEGPLTYAWPRQTTYRFQNKDGCILIWDGEQSGVDWFLSAESPTSLLQLTQTVWTCGSLANTLYELNGCKEPILERLRG